ERPMWMPAVLTALLMVTLVAEVLAPNPRAMIGHWAISVVPAIYIGVLGAHFALLRGLPDGRAWVLLMLFGTFATDTGAYAVGRALGRRKLAPHVSPG